MLEIVSLFLRFEVKDDDSITNKVCNLIILDKLYKIFNISRSDTINPFGCENEITLIIES